MSLTQGLDHLGLTVRDLDQTTAFFVDVLGWKETARDPSYPRSTVTDGNLRLTLWQADVARDMVAFDRKANIGLHHLALRVDSRETLDLLTQKVAATDGVVMEFTPEPMGKGPRMHTIFAEPGGLRIELLWAGA